MPLLWLLRDILNLTGTKFGCGAGLCGACTVHVDGLPMRACQVDVSEALDKEITTIEGVAGEVAEAVVQAWRELDVVQCGYCQSGQIMQAIGLLDGIPDPTDEEIVVAMDGNICRCCSYPDIKKAIKMASRSASSGQ